MTTILWTGAVLFADSSMTVGGTVMNKPLPKLYWLKDARLLVGIAGSYQKTKAVLRWLATGAADELAPSSEEGDVWECIAVKSPEQAFSGYGGPIMPAAGREAVGSGRTIALAALAGMTGDLYSVPTYIQGSTAMDLTSKMDIHTAGPTTCGYVDEHGCLQGAVGVVTMSNDEPFDAFTYWELK